MLVWWGGLTIAFVLTSVGCLTVGGVCWWVGLSWPGCLAFHRDAAPIVPSRNVNVLVVTSKVHAHGSSGNDTLGSNPFFLSAARYAAFVESRLPAAHDSDAEVLFNPLEETDDDETFFAPSRQVGCSSVSVAVEACVVVGKDGHVDVEFV